MFLPVEWCKYTIYQSVELKLHPPITMQNYEHDIALPQASLVSNSCPQPEHLKESLQVNLKRGITRHAVVVDIVDTSCTLNVEILGIVIVVLVVSVLVVVAGFFFSIFFFKFYVWVNPETQFS